MKRWLRRRLVLAAPTCTLWTPGFWNGDYYLGWRFRFNRRWRIGLAELYQVGGRFQREV